MPNSRRNTRRNRKNRGLASTLYSPFHHLAMAGEEAVGAVTNTVKGVARTGIRGVNRIGRSVTGHANSAIRNVVSRKRRGGRRSRRSRRTSRKNRRSSRKNRN
jgi:hypothetical protein